MCDAEYDDLAILAWGDEDLEEAEIEEILATFDVQSTEIDEDGTFVQG